jgi:hypothetical protein
MADSDPKQPATPVDPEVQKATAVADAEVRKAANRYDAEIQKVRSWAGLAVVAAGDVAIVVASVFGILHVSGGDKNATSVVAILSSGFTAVGTMTTAYFGIRAASNTAQSSISNRPPG